jgi:hypothetical protein
MKMEMYFLISLLVNQEYSVIKVAASNNTVNSHLVLHISTDDKGKKGRLRCFAGRAYANMYFVQMNDTWHGLNYRQIVAGK